MTFLLFLFGWQIANRAGRASLTSLPPLLPLPPSPGPTASRRKTKLPKGVLPPDGELQQAVRPLDEDEGFLPAAVQRRPVDVHQLVADPQLGAQGGLPSILDLETKRSVEMSVGGGRSTFIS